MNQVKEFKITLTQQTSKHDYLQEELKIERQCKKRLGEEIQTLEEEYSRIKRPKLCPTVDPNLFNIVKDNHELLQRNAQLKQQLSLLSGSVPNLQAQSLLIEHLQKQLRECLTDLNTVAKEKDNESSTLYESIVKEECEYRNTFTSLRDQLQKFSDLLDEYEQRRQILLQQSQ